MYFKWCLIMMLMMRSSAKKLSCAPRKEVDHHFVYECSRPLDSKQKIEVKIKFDSHVDVLCEGNFKCGEFPKIAPKDVGEISTLNLNGCGNDLSVMCALDGVNVRASKLYILRLSEAPLNLNGFKELNIVEFYEYGDKDNEDWLPTLALEQMPRLLQLVIAKGRTRLHVGQFAHMKKLRNLEFVNSLNKFPPLIFNGYDNELHTITMAYNNITKLTADHFKGLERLEVLELFYDKIDSLPLDVFKYLHSLNLLDLSGNNIKKILPQTFRNLPFLETLRLKNNRHLENLDKDVFMGLSALNTLELRDCGLKQLPETLLQPLTNLVTLDLSHNQISDLPKSFLNSNTKLQTLDLSNNNLKNIHSTSLAPAVNLKFLYLDFNKLEFGNVLESPFKELKNISVLDLANNNIKRIYEDWRVVLKNLKELDLSFNSFAGFLKKTELAFTQHITVNLHNNKISGIIDNTKVSKENLGNALLLLENNPFLCDCRLAHMLSVMKEPGLGEGLMYEMRNAKCSSPPEMAGTPLVDVNVRPC